MSHPRHTKLLTHVSRICIQETNRTLHPLKYAYEQHAFTLIAQKLTDELGYHPSEAEFAEELQRYFSLIFLEEGLTHIDRLDRLRTMATAFETKEAAAICYELLPFKAADRTDAQRYSLDRTSFFIKREKKSGPVEDVSMNQPTTPMFEYGARSYTTKSNHFRHKLIACGLSEDQADA